MTNQEFQRQQLRLIAEYDPTGKIYGAERVAAIQNRFRHFTEEKFSMLIDRAFASERFAPMASDLSRLWREIETEAWNLEKNKEDAKRRDDFDSQRGAGPEAIKKIFQEGPPFMRLIAARSEGSGQ